MKRSKKIVFVSHCIVNANSKVKGLALYSNVLRRLVADFIAKDYGLVQLPCPELQYLGLKRWSMTKEQYDFAGFRHYCRELARTIVIQMEIYQAEGYQLCGVYGIDGSPTCGVKYSCAGYQGGCFDSCGQIEEVRTEEQGVFIEELAALIKAQSIQIEWYSVDESRPEVWID